MIKKKVGIFCGGFSQERAISLASGRAIFEAVNREKWEPYLVEIDRQRWIATGDNGLMSEVPIGCYFFTYKDERVTFDIIFNSIHGTPGEDGILAASAALAKIPQTSCTNRAASITYGKHGCLTLLEHYNIPSAKRCLLDNNEKRPPIISIVKKVGLPCFIKPNCSGSSIGIYKVRYKHELEEAIDKAFLVDNQVLVESMLSGREFSVGALRINGRITVLPITEIISENDFFDYEAKYCGAAKEITPAEINKDLENKLERAMKTIYTKLALEGIVRCEFIIQHSVPYLLDVNTVPGFTKSSIIPKQACAFGLSMAALIDISLSNALK